MRFALVGLILMGCANSQSGSKPPDAAPTPTDTTTGAAAPPMLSDEAISAAVTAKQEILIVKVTKVDATSSGSRSDATTYILEILKTALGTSTGALKLAAYGPPKLVEGHEYVVSTRDGNPMLGAKGLRESVEIQPGQEDLAAKAHADKAKK